MTNEYPLTAEELQEGLSKGEAFYLSQLNYDLLNEADCMDTVVVLPRDYHKRTQGMGNAFVQICYSFKGEEKLKNELIRIATSLSYLLNSTSYCKNKYQDFDKQEIDRKLGRNSDK